MARKKRKRHWAMTPVEIEESVIACLIRGEVQRVIAYKHGIMPKTVRSIRDRAGLKKRTYTRTHGILTVQPDELELEAIEQRKAECRDAHMLAMYRSGDADGYCHNEGNSARAETTPLPDPRGDFEAFGDVPVSDRTGIECDPAILEEVRLWYRRERKHRHRGAKGKML